jgi:hypothetical protein
MPGQVLLHGLDLFAHRVAVSEHSARPYRNAVTFRRQSLKALAATAQEDRYTEFVFKLPYPAGQARLRDVATLGSASEMTLFRNCNQIAKLSKEHFKSLNETSGRESRLAEIQK